MGPTVRQAAGGIPGAWALAGLLVGVAAFVVLSLVIYLSLVRSQSSVLRSRPRSTVATRMLADQLARGDITYPEYRRVVHRLENRPAGAGRGRGVHQEKRR